MQVKRIHNDPKRGDLGQVAFVGLTQSLVAAEGAGSDITAICGTLSMDLAGSAPDQAALECLFSEFMNVFEKLS